MKKCRIFAALFDKHFGLLFTLSVCNHFVSGSFVNCGPDFFTIVFNPIQLFTNFEASKSISIMDNNTFNLHIDYTDGKVYTDVEDGLPVFSQIYDEYPTFITFSQPCRCTTSDNRNTETVYVIAISCAINNDGTRNSWRGFVEIPKDKKDDDWSFVENVFKEELTLDVIRWHYIGEEPISYLEQLSICEQGSTAL